MTSNLKVDAQEITIHLQVGLDIASFSARSLHVIS